MTSSSTTTTTSQKYNNITHTTDTHKYHKHNTVTNKHIYETYLKSDTFNYQKKVENKQIVVKQVPAYINQENHYTFIKHNNQQLLDMIANLQQQINNLQQQINNLP